MRIHQLHLYTLIYYGINTTPTKMYIPILLSCIYKIFDGRRGWGIFKINNYNFIFILSSLIISDGESIR